ncbi:hypothetical protein IJH46_02160 [Candidatus Saccharibacteria bacterium]|nr:hypothetical protein [Candidatus Saccharibacteria bacterium]
MENNNAPIFTPETNNFNNANNQNFIPINNDQPKKNNKKLFIIIGAVLLVAGIAVATVLLLNRGSNNDGQTEGGDTEILAPEGETAEVIELEESFEGNGGEASFVDYQTSLINSDNAEDSFDARLDLSSYYISVQDFAAAEPLLVGLDTSGFTTEQFYRYYNVMTRYYDGLGDTAKRDEYTALSAQYRNLLQQEAEAASAE